MTQTIQEFDFSVNLLRAILWEYNDATNLQGILNAKDAWYVENQTDFWNDWITDVFDLRTANQFGLVVWGIILGMQLYVNTPPQPDAIAFGFNDTSFFNFDNGIFGSNGGSTYVLPVETQRIALQLRYVQLTTSGCVPDINRQMKRIFAAYGDVWLLDYGNMKQAYIFDFAVTADLQYLFDNYDILPRPAGVKSGYYDLTQMYFGFDAGHLNFDNGVFGDNV